MICVHRPGGLARRPRSSPRQQVAQAASGQRARVGHARSSLGASRSSRRGRRRGPAGVRQPLPQQVGDGLWRPRSGRAGATRRRRPATRWPASRPAAADQHEHRRAVVDLVLELAADAHAAGRGRLAVEDDHVDPALVEPRRSRRARSRTSTTPPAGGRRRPPAEREPDLARVSRRRCRRGHRRTSSRCLDRSGHLRLLGSGPDGTPPMLPTVTRRVLCRAGVEARVTTARRSGRGRGGAETAAGPP